MKRSKLLPGGLTLALLCPMFAGEVAAQVEVHERKLGAGGPAIGTAGNDAAPRICSANETSSAVIAPSKPSGRGVAPVTCVACWLWTPAISKHLMVSARSCVRRATKPVHSGFLKN